MDKISKYLLKLPVETRACIKLALGQIVKNDLSGLAVKKLAGHGDLYRVRLGNIRIIYRKADPYNLILQVSGRNEQTYRDF